MTLRLHAVIGGEGPPLLLVHGWPENWYAWRLLMPALARDFEVIAVDQRGMGLSDKPQDGYDTGTLADDLVALMDALGHERFAVVGHDTGFAISYALAADHPDRVERVALAEIPGLPGNGSRHRPCSSPGRSTTGSGTSASTGSTSCNEQLVAGREDIFFGWEFAAARREEAPGRRRSTTTSASLSNPDCPARQLRVVPGARHDHRAGRAAQGPAADHARPGDRRRGKLR